MKLVLSLLAASLAFTGIAAAAEGDQSPTIASPTATRLASPSGLAASSETTIAGLVTDANSSPLKDISVKLYVGGLLVAEAKTSTDGSFEMSELLDYGRDVTIDLWFVPPTKDLLMENVILKESSSAIAHSLYSKCVKRARLDPITDVIVKMVDAETRALQIQRSGCAGN